MDWSRADVKRILELGAWVIVGRKQYCPRICPELLENSDRKIVLGIVPGKAGLRWRMGFHRISAEEFGAHAGTGVRRHHRYQPGRFTGGPNIAATRNMAVKTGLEIIASGGVASLKDLQELKKLEAVGVSGVIIGKALYNGAFSLAEALAVVG